MGSRCLDMEPIKSSSKRLAKHWIVGFLAGLPALRHKASMVRVGILAVMCKSGEFS